VQRSILSTPVNSLTVDEAPYILTQPASQSVCVGNSASFTATAGGYQPPTVQWQANAGSGFINLTGANTTTLAFAVSSIQSGNQYRALFTNNAGSGSSNAVTLTVNTAPVITSQPATQTVNAGQPVTFTVGST
jgi:Immunoglobulin I-set domain